MKKNLLTLVVLPTLSLNTLANDYKSGDIIVRGGATMVDPNSYQSGVYVEVLGGNTFLISLSR